MNLHPVLESGWLNAILPELILCVGGMVLILFAAFVPRAKAATASIAVIFLIITMWSERLLVKGGTFFGGTYQISAITRIFDLTFLLAAMLATLFAHDYLEREGIEGGEFYALLMWGTVGMMMMAKGLDLLIIILGLEILSICIFVLVGYQRRLPVSNEASLKYFLMGAFATGFILYGTALFYGATQSTNITAMARYFATADTNNPLLAIAFVLMMSGFGFKLALAPFHPWAPDVYQGAPTPVAGWLSVAPKAATLIALIRIFWAMTPMLQQTSWMKMVAALSILSMIVGNAVAIVQRDLKRMLAYSGIAHVGYMMIAMLTVRDDSVAADRGLHHRVRAHEHRRVRRRLDAGEEPERSADARRHRRPRIPPAVLRAGADHLHVLALRPSAHGRLHLEVLHLQDRDRVGSHHRGTCRHHHQYLFGVLLPARGVLPLHEGAG